MSAGENGYPDIADYAIIGDCRSAALISRRGSLDWLCMPRFDSPSVFAALIDRHRGGCFAIQPRDPFESTRRYLPDTNVLETVFTTRKGRLRLLDLMPIASEQDKRQELWPEHQVLRLVECLEGQVEVQVICDPRPRYGKVVPRLRNRGLLGFHYERGADALLLRSEIPLHQSHSEPGVRGRERMKKGDRRHVSLVYTLGEAGVIPVFGAKAEHKINTTVQWWRTWARRCRYDGPYRADVVRSALALKLMTFAPSGAVIAAPTTSLPEHIGGARNWDYRYCWLRDASLTLQALADLGYGAEAEAFVSWLIHSTRLTAPRLQVLYSVYGESRLRERVLDHLEGYRQSRPVRVGNAACEQLQLDTYGEVVDAVYEFVRRSGRLDRSTGRVLRGFGQAVCRIWRTPDHGVWETRGEPRHHTYSKVMCWVTLDRLLKLHQAGYLPKLPVARFRRERDAIRAQVERNGFDARLNSYVSFYGGRSVDASLLLLARYGYTPARSPRMLSTCQRIHEQLERNGLIYRYLDYEDGLPGGEGAFGIASFWFVQCRTRQGAVDEAARRFEHLCSLANEVGLFAEEVDPETGAPLGNFPQAFTHVGLVDAALTLAEATGQPDRASAGARREPESARAP